VWDAIDGERTSSADAFATVGIKLDRLDIFAGEARVHDIEHFQERGTGWNIFGLVFLESAGSIGVFLAPDFEVEIHGEDYL
jgi:hypothetical protein